MEEVLEWRLAGSEDRRRPLETFRDLMAIDADSKKQGKGRDETPRSLEGPWFGRLVLYSLTSSIFALVPLLDEHLLRGVRRRLVREAASDKDLSLSDIEVTHLSGTGAKSTWGCFVGFLVARTFGLATRLVRRFFRNVLLFLAVKDAVDAFSKTFHEGFLLHFAMPDLESQLATLNAHGTTLEHRGRELVPEIKTLRASIERTFEEIDTRPFEATIKSVLRGSRRILRRAARILGREARQAEKIDPEAEPGPENGQRLAPELYEALISTLLRQETYLLALAQHFRQHWNPTATREPTRAPRS